MLARVGPEPLRNGAPRPRRRTAATARASSGGRASAPPISSAPSMAKPQVSPCAEQGQPQASTSSPPRAAVCQRPCRAMAQARGWALANSGIRASDHRAPAAATACRPSAMARPDSHQDGRKVSVPDTSAPYKPAQGGRDIGQQRRRHHIAQRDADRPGEQRQHRQFHRHQRDQAAQRCAKGAQGAHHRAALFEGQADGAMHDEQAHRKGQQAKGRQVQMKAVGQAGDISVLPCGRQRQIGGHLGQRAPGQGLVGCHQQMVDLARAIQQALRDADVGEGCARGKRLVRRPCGIPVAGRRASVSACAKIWPCPDRNAADVRPRARDCRPHAAAVPSADQCRRSAPCPACPRSPATPATPPAAGRHRCPG